MRGGHRTSFRVLAGAAFVTGLRGALVFAFVPGRFEALGGTPSLVGLGLASAAALQFLLATPWGMLSDRHGRKLVLLTNVFAAALLWAVSAGTSSLWVFTAAQVLQGAFGADFAITEAFVGDVSEGAERTEGLGQVGALYAVGVTLGPALGAATYQALGPTGIFWFAAGSTMASGLALVAFFREPPRHQSGAAPAVDGLVARAWRTPGLPAFLSSLVLGAAGIGLYEGSLALRLSRAPFSFDAEGIGWVFAYLGLVGAAVQWQLVHRVARRFGDGVGLLCGMAIFATGLTLFSSTDALAGLLAFLGFAAAGIGLTSPTVAALLATFGGAHHKGEVVSLGGAATMLGMVVGLGLSGLLNEVTGASSVLLLAAAFMLMALFPVGAALRRLAAARPGADASPR